MKAKTKFMKSRKKTASKRRKSSDGICLDTDCCRAESLETMTDRLEETQKNQ